MKPAAWNAERYLRFAAERTQPARDLAQRIALDRPALAVDLGCGPGNSTEILAARFPDTAIIGVDNSPEMLARARADYPPDRFPKLSWQIGDLADWQAERPADLIFSNAAFHWAPDHGRLLPRLAGQLNPGGVLAFQVPDNFQTPSHLLIKDIAADGPWAAALKAAPAEPASVDTPGRYYDILSATARGIEIWQTTYHHVMPDHAAIVEWVSGTALRPILAALGADWRAAFLQRYEAALAEVFAPQNDGSVVFPFRRIFVIARF